MANRILKDIGWETRIQKKMGVDPAYLPETDIQQPEVITVAEANIIAQIPDYATLQDDKKVYLEAAVVCECASLLCPSMAARLPKREQGPHETHELEIDWNKKKAEFEVERDGYVGKILPPSSTLLHFGLSQ
jgi:hypothetical protein